MHSLLQDLRYTLRQWRRAPGFAIMAVLTLALGIGANTAIFLLTYTILLKGLPVPHPGQLVNYTYTNGHGQMQFTYKEYAALAEHVKETQGLFAWTYSPKQTLTRKGQTASLNLGLATGSIGHVLELRPYRGRLLSPNAGEPGVPFAPEAMLSYGYWRAHFHGDPTIVGRSIDIDHTSVAVVGILPRRFQGIDPEDRIDALLPLDFETIENPASSMLKMDGAFFLRVMGRLRPGQSIASVQASLRAQEAQITAQADPSHVFFGKGSMLAGYHFVLQPGRTGDSNLAAEYRQPLLALEILCGLMMLLCAVNTGLLILSRVTGRLHEFAVRSALGAARHRLMAQVMMEALLLTLAGLFFGTWIGWELAQGLVAVLSSIGEPPLLHLQVGVWVLLFSLGVSLAAATLAGLWPAWRASRTAPMLELKQVRSTQGPRSMSRFILPVQVALGLLLVYASLLLTGTLREYLKQISGYNPSHLTMAELNFQNNDPKSADQMRKELLLVQGLSHAPGVQGAALMSEPVLRGYWVSSYYFTRDSSGHLHSSGQAWGESVTPGYFATMGTPLLDGRTFRPSDIGGDKVCVLNQAAERFYFPGGNAVGQFISTGSGTPSRRKAANHYESCRVIGIAQNAHMSSLTAPAPMAVYRLIEQQKHPYVTAFLAVRASSDALAASAIRHAAAEYLPGTAPPLIYSFERVVNDDLSQQRMVSGVSGGFALLALLLVATGLYGILSRQVTERRREIGIRMALGAERRAIVAQLARRTAWRIAIGVVGGFALAFATGRLMRSLLYGVTLHSSGVVLGTLTMLLGVLALAFLLPAARAASVQPAEAIREE
jgi:predicted permease